MCCWFQWKAALVFAGTWGRASIKLGWLIAEAFIELRSHTTVSLCCSRALRTNSTFGILELEHVYISSKFPNSTFGILELEHVYISSKFPNPAVRFGAVHSLQTGASLYHLLNTEKFICGTLLQANALES
mmetsp:Transcript_142894/g.456483  ORF Transcript_142894/g.456483 Transcript_142894/m.456483 type:complete len:130 (-) Transcript_142894:501-890(-)